MAPGTRNNFSNEDSSTTERKIRKPLVEKKRRARINESLKELRVLIADADLKMENAEVLDLTVRRVEDILHSRAREVDAVNQEACERFSAGYIQCMHDVHTFVSNCSGIEPSVATELLNHLLESMPLNNEDHFRFLVPDSMAELPWSQNELLCSGVISPPPSSDELFSDLDETEQSHVSLSEESTLLCLLPNYSKLMWRPW
ncbi:hypothetical protein WMY93_001352 [Mugilogobius chulae]|uniref:Hes family bHLH transcription factor 6 n=1 Tax=Mugilogobius chulae TaxID=88201 RepID=A0AAW0Q212_9GOBI